jgi:hypothetical protein
MHQALRYSQFARECGRLAARARNPDDQACFRNMASEWLLLAELNAEAAPPRLHEPLSFRPCEGD